MMKKIFFAIIALLTVSAVISCSKKDTTPDEGPASFTVTFDSRGGSSVLSQTVKNGGHIMEPSTPTKSGYYFMGWCEDEAGESWDFKNDVVKADITLYAKWAAEKPNSVTVMYYGAGGGNLDYKQIWKIRQCVNIGASDRVNMTFEYKFSSEQQEDDDYSDYKGVIRMDLADASSMKGCTVYSMTTKNMLKNMEGLPFKQYSTNAALDMSQPEEISKFIKWSMEKHPADKYVLIFADHGGGWNILDDEAGCVPTKGVIYDDNNKVDSNSKCVSAKNIRDGIKQSGAKIEVLYLDACLMSAWENLYEYKEAPVSYVACSMEVSYGGNYNLMLSELLETPAEPAEAFKRYIDRHIANFEDGWDMQYVDMGIINLSKISAMTSIIKEIGNTFMSQMQNSDEQISSTASSSLRSALMSSWNNVWTPLSVGEKLVEIYNAPYELSKDEAWYRVKSDLVLLLRSNHEKVWDSLPEKDTDNAIYNIMNQSVYGLSLGDILSENKGLWDEVKTDGYESQKQTAERLYSSYIQAMKSMSYINCNHKVSEDQPYVEVSPSVNIMALNEDGWKPWIQPYRSNYNTIKLASSFDLSDAINLYSQSTFSKETGWVDMLKVNPFNPSPLSNDSRTTRYYKK